MQEHRSPRSVPASGGCRRRRDRSGLISALSSRRCTPPARWWAAATTLVALFSDRSLPAGLPVTRRSEDSQQVVTQLKCFADRLAVTAEHGQRRLIAPGHGSADLQRSTDRVVAGFAAKHVQHPFPSREAAASLTRSANWPTASSVRIASYCGQTRDNAALPVRSPATSARPRPGTGHRVALLPTRRIAAASRTTDGRDATVPAARGLLAGRAATSSRPSRRPARVRTHAGVRSSRRRAAPADRRRLRTASRDNEGRAHALAAADQARQHIGGDIHVRTAQSQCGVLRDE